MRFRRLATAVLGCSALFLSGTAYAECTKDTDCKGTRICENAICVTPPEPAASAPAEPVASAPPPAEPEPPYEEPAPPREESEPKPEATVRRSTGLMASGIVLVSLGGLAGLIAVISFSMGGACDDASSASDCDELDSVALRSTIAFVILEGAGIPMLVYGAKRVPAEPPRARLQLSPWASPNAGGLRLSGSF